MAIVDTPERSQTVQEGADEVRHALATIISVADVHLMQIRKLVKVHGRAELAAELGSDAPALLEVYNTLKDAIEQASGTVIEDL